MISVAFVQMFISKIKVVIIMSETLGKHRQTELVVKCKDINEVSSFCHVWTYNMVAINVSWVLLTDTIYIFYSETAWQNEKNIG